MDKQELHEKLERLHEELSRAESSDSSQREILQQVVTDIQKMLARQEETTEHYRGLGGPCPKSLWPSPRLADD